MKWVGLFKHVKPDVMAKAQWVRSMPFVAQPVLNSQGFGTWYPSGTMLGAGTLGSLATSPACLRQVIQIIECLEPDEYVRYLLAYYRAGLDRFADAWQYADITTVLLATTQMLQPQNYLEIGVRRGRSMAMVARTCPECEIVGIDLWTPDYAGMPNPGPDFVRAELNKIGHTGRLELFTGDSHKILPQLFGDHPEVFFDVITVDGDHSKKGATQDLRDVLPRLKVGGVLVFDDICHPMHPYLARVWQEVVCANSCFSTWQFTELGYGVAVAVRKW